LAPVAGVDAAVGVPDSSAPAVGEVSGRAARALTSAPVIREVPGFGCSSASWNPSLSAAVLFVKGTIRRSE
jgi:hypothetical protein